VVRIRLSGYTEFSSITNAINEGAVYKFLTKPLAIAASPLPRYRKGMQY